MKDVPQVLKVIHLAILFSLCCFLHFIVIVYVVYIIYHDWVFNSKRGICDFFLYIFFSENESHSVQNEKQSLSVIPKTFVGNETFDGKMVLTSFYTIFLT